MLHLEIYVFDKVYICIIKVYTLYTAQCFKSDVEKFDYYVGVVIYN